MRIILISGVETAMRLGQQRPTPDLLELLETRYDDLRRFAARKARSIGLAEEVMQDAWLKLADLTRSPDFDPGKVRQPIGYLRTVVANLVIDRQRQALVMAERIEPGELAEEVPSDAPTAFSVLSGRQELEVVRGAVAELPEKCRAVILLYRGEDLTMRQVADRLGVSPRTVENHLARAMSHCRRRLREARGDD